MVEGPGCKLKGENIKQKLKGKKLINISAKHSAYSTSEKCVERKQTQCNQITHRSLEEVLTLGKELFMIFGDLCLRVHFLMNGSHRISSSEAKDTSKKEPPVLILEFCDSCLFFYQSSFDVRPAQPCLQRYEELKDIDICSPFFNHKRVVSLIMEQKGRQLCDILLDQNIMPGVGNIIKNEALFDSGINPCLLVDKLQREHVSHIVKMTRDFTMIFYKCRKSGSPLHKHYKIYAQQTCKSCETRVTKTKMGDDSGRVTYFCPKCQTSDTNKLDKLILPSRNSLLSWVKSSTSIPNTESDWSCPACTLLNPANKFFCDICLGPKPGLSVENRTDVISHKLVGRTEFGSSASKETLNHTRQDSLGSFATNQTLNHTIPDSLDFQELSPISSTKFGSSTSKGSLNHTRQDSMALKELSNHSGTKLSSIEYKETLSHHAMPDPLKELSPLSSHKLGSTTSKGSLNHLTRPNPQAVKELSHLSKSKSPFSSSLSNSKSPDSTSLTTNYNFNKRNSPTPKASSNLNGTSSAMALNQHGNKATELKTKSTSSSVVALNQHGNKTTELKISPHEKSGTNKRKSLDSVVGGKNKRIKKTDENSVSDLESKSKFPQCFQHKLTCSLWQTHKPGANKNRWFFTCSLKGNQKCNFFEWSDKRFPVCPGHGKTCGYHTVLKIGANNGRKFFSCSLPKKEQCQFFAWAEGFGDCGPQTI